MTPEKATVVAAVITASVGAIVLLIVTWTNARVTRTAFRLELFERRWAVWDSMMSILVAMASDAGHLDYKFVVAKLSGTEKAVFLLDSESQDFVKLVRDRAFRMIRDNKKLSRRLEPQNKESLEKDVEATVQWAFTTIGNPRDTPFAKYLVLDDTTWYTPALNAARRVWEMAWDRTRLDEF